MEQRVYQFLTGAHSKTGSGPLLAIMSIKSTQRRPQGTQTGANPGIRHG